jgi:hypothetical protein
MMSSAKKPEHHTQRCQSCKHESAKPKCRTCQNAGIFAVANIAALLDSIYLTQIVGPIRARHFVGSVSCG